MTFEFISLLPLGGGTPGGSAAPVTGFASVTGAGTTGTESELNRLSQDIARAVCKMSEIPSNFLESKNLAPAKRPSREALKALIYALVQDYIRQQVKDRRSGELVETAIDRVAREHGLTSQEIKGLWNGQKRKIDGDVLVILLPIVPGLRELISSAAPAHAEEISQIRATLKDATRRLERLVREPA